MNQNQAEKYMREAISEGRKALGKCTPNPPVGCVLVKDQEIISKGHTSEPGLPHAEAMALSQVDGTLDNVVAFVTLEPCSFHGRTPSCAQELVKRGIQEVYVGMIDPHPKNQGAGIKILREAGVLVHVGLLEKDIKNDLESHLYSHS
jgi:pyrimidine deaminase RibD-like protein